MHWDDLRIVAAVRNKGSYAKASKDLRIDETTVSRRLTRVQDALGFTLFDAIDGSRKPTPQCEAMLDHIDEMAQAAAKIDAISSQTSSPTGIIRVTSTSSIAEQLLAPGMGDFLVNNPGLSLKLSTSNDNLNFSRWEADLAIRLGKPAKGNFAIRKLANIQLVFIRPKNKADGQNCFVCSYPEELGDTLEMQELLSMGIPEPTRLKTSNIWVIFTVLKSYSGIGILPKYITADLLEDKELIVTPLAVHREAWLLIQPHLKNDPATRLVIDWIVQQFDTME